MGAADFTIVELGWARARSAAHRVRHAVFVVEQGVPEALEWDGQDGGCVHLLALDGSGRAVGTARMFADGRIGRMAVLVDWRGRGVGSGLLQVLVAIAGRRCLAQVTLAAQIHASEFYARHGFAPIGERFLEAGIPHQRMVRWLGPPGAEPPLD